MIKEMMVPDPEIEAMSSIADALAAIDDEAARSRVIRWAAERFDVGLPFSNNGRPTPRTLPHMETDETGAPEGVGGDPESNSIAAVRQFEHFAELYDAVQPKSDTEKAVTAAFWFQSIQGAETWQAVQLSKELKNLGHNLTNISSSLTAAKERKPAHVLQIKKSGSAQQGRKTYKLSAEGLKFIRSRISLNGQS